MKYHSTNGIVGNVNLDEAVIKGLAADKGLFMPENIKQLPDEFFERIDKMSLDEVAYRVADALFGEDITASDLKKIVSETLSFNIPLVCVKENIFALELFHGPTLAFKDVGARFMARMLRHFIKGRGSRVNVLVATSGDTGSAVANGFLNVEGVHVYILYPKGKVSDIQEKQFTTLGHNITALEIDGCFDDCQALVKSAFMDEELTSKMFLTSANSINLARLLPQSFYYFWAYAQLKSMGLERELVVSVPCGNFGNLTAALFAKRMGLPIKRFIAANNSNDVVYNYLQTGKYNPRPSVATIANAMDVGSPSNFARIMALYNADHASVCADITGAAYNDNQIAEAIEKAYKETGYLLDPHGACAYLATHEGLGEGETGVFLETAHPAKFKETIESILQQEIQIPDALQKFISGNKQTIELSGSFKEFKEYLLKEVLHEGSEIYY